MNKQKDTRTALVDLELIIYKCAAKAEAEGTNLRDLVSMTNLSIREVVDGCQASNYYLVVSGTDNFRKRLYPETYKAGRPPKPPLYKDLYMEIQATYGAKRFKWHDQIEADDLLGIMLTNGRIENPILCSIDKDMLGIPGWHYNWNKDAWPTYVSQDEADHHWLVQLLTGDSTDGIRGMEGIGPVKANKLIKQYRSIMNLHSVPEMAKYIYENEEINLDRYYETLYLVSIWRANMPEELLANDLIASIVKTIPSIN
jgi:hypothetical protein